MKLKELTYFMEAYAFPMVRHFYPTDEALWRAFHEKESAETIAAIRAEIQWLNAQPPSELKQVRRYLNQIGIMVPIRFENEAAMLLFFNKI